MPEQIPSTKIAAITIAVILTIFPLMQKPPIKKSDNSDKLCKGDRRKIRLPPQ